MEQWSFLLTRACNLKRYPTFSNQKEGAHFTGKEIHRDELIRHYCSPFLCFMLLFKEMTADYVEAIFKVWPSHLESKEEMLIACLFIGTVNCKNF
jgi:hypothetical protein